MPKTARPFLFDDLDRTVVVAVVAVRVVEAPIDDIVDMIPVLDRLVSTTGAMDMPVLMSGLIAATFRMRGIDR